MAWAKLINRATGEFHYDSTPDAFDGDLWEVLPIVEDRCPEGIEEVDGQGNIFVSLAARRAQIWERVKAIRTAKESGTASTPVGEVAIDEASKLKISGALSLCRLQEELQQPFAIKFTLADESRVPLDNVTVRQLAGAVGTFVAALYDHAGDLKDALDAAASLAELDAIDIDTGWPS